jgi:betaine-aldehyde dehydrogenase
MSQTTTTTRSYGHFIGGASEPLPEHAIARRSPASGALVAQYADGTAADVDRAVAAARSQFSGAWPRLSGLDRGDVLHELARRMAAERDLLVEIEVAEGGKPIRIARGDVDASIRMTGYAAGLGAQLHGDAYTNLGPDYTGMLLREPIGVVACIIPWNFPLLVFCEKVPFALAAGCTVVVKPSEMTSGTALEVSRMAAEAGLPDGALNVVTGYGDPVGQTMVDHPDIDLVSFTGSTATGRIVLEGQKVNLKRISTELGGKGATIVFDDADLEAAADGVVMGGFFSMGQECASGSRLLVQDSIAEPLLGRVMERIGDLRSGDPFDERTDIGPLIHDGHGEKVAGHVDRAQADGANLLCGGRFVTAGERGEETVYEPTVLDAVSPEMEIFRQEVFGPVISVTRFTATEQAVELANDTEYGLANAVFTQDVDKALNVGRALRSGTVWVNTSIDGSPQLSFGGYKASGTGRQMGQAGIEEFTELKSLHVRTGPRPPFFGKVQS